MRFEFEAELWEYPGEAPWVFVTLPEETAEAIRESEATRRPFGSIGVTVQVGATTWQTSLFPEPESGSYVLPVKADVRRNQSLTIGDVATFRVELST